MNFCKCHFFRVIKVVSVLCLALPLCFTSCEDQSLIQPQENEQETGGTETGAGTETNPEAGEPAQPETGQENEQETGGTETGAGTETNPEAGEPAQPETGDPKHPRTFDYTALAQYKTAPNSLLVSSMPADLRAKLDACLYTGPIGANGWYADAALETATNQAAQAFFTAMAQYVNTGGTDDFLKIKMLHDWIIDYLDYDFDVADGFVSRDIAQGSQSATNILRRGNNFRDSSHGTGVCQGYAALFHAFMEKLIPLDNGITWADRIRGWQGAPGPNSGFSTDGIPTNHEWNQVMIDGTKFIVDCTFDDPVYGGGGGAAGGLFPNPAEYVYISIPKYNAQQLLDDDGSAPWDSHVVTWSQYVNRR